MVDYDFIAIDFETAGSDLSAPCSIGIACIKGLEVVDTYYSLLRQPASAFSPQAIRIHGITPDMVHDAPTMEEFWPQIAHLFDPHCPVVAHNAHFDMSVLRLVLSDCSPDITYTDTIQLIGPFVRGSHALDNCAAELGINMGEHHNAMDDAITCAKLAIYAIAYSGSLSLWECLARRDDVYIHRLEDITPQLRLPKPRKPKFTEYVRPADVTPSAQACINSSHPLCGKRIVFTGQLSLDRRTAMQMAADSGAIVVGSVSKKTDYLVVGEQDPSIVGDDGLSGKQEDAIAINASGKGHIVTLTETEFVDLVKGGVPVG